MIEITEIHTQADLDALRGEWDDLLHRSSNAGIFQSWEWISTCRKFFGRGSRLLIVCIRTGGRLAGLAPMEITRMYGLPFRRLQFIGTGISDYLDFILDSESIDSVMEAISGWFMENSRRWDLLDLQQIPEGSPALQFFGSNGLPDNELITGEVCPYLPTADSWDGMLSRFGKKMRWNLGYYERLIRRDFDDVFLGVLPDDEIDNGMDAFFGLHTKRWRKRWLPGMLVGTRKQGFHCEIARLCAGRGWLRLYGLKLNGRIQSVLYCFVFKEKAYYYLGGFDPSLSKYSLGTVLTGFAIRGAIENGCREFDFLRGDEHYKFRWTKEIRTNTRIVSRIKTLRSGMASGVCRLEQKIERKVKEELHKRIGAG